MIFVKKLRFSSVQNQIDEKTAKTSTRGMTQDEIISQTFIFFVAGFETTATTLTAAIYLLLQNPDYIQKIREEADSVKITDCNSLNETRLVKTNSSANDHLFLSIPWTTAVINETLRMVPPVGVHIRVAKELKSEIEVKGIKFRQGLRKNINDRFIDLLATREKTIW